MWHSSHQAIAKVGADSDVDRGVYLHWKKLSVTAKCFIRVFHDKQIWQICEIWQT